MQFWLHMIGKMLFLNCKIVIFKFLIGKVNCCHSSEWNVSYQITCIFYPRIHFDWCTCLHSTPFLFHTQSIVQKICTALGRVSRTKLRLTNKIPTARWSIRHWTYLFMTQCFDTSGTTFFALWPNNYIFF